MDILQVFRYPAAWTRPWQLIQRKEANAFLWQLFDQQWAHRFGIYLPVFHSRIQAWPFALKTLALAQVGERSKGAAGQQSIQRIEQSVATFTKNAPIYRA